MKCPVCKSEKVHEIICGGPLTSKGKKVAFAAFDLYPLRPAEKFECQTCKHRWVNPKFEEYLLARTVKQATIKG